MGRGLMLPNGQQQTQAQVIKVPLLLPSNPEHPEVPDSLMTIFAPVPSTAAEITQDSILKTLAELLRQIVHLRAEMQGITLVQEGDQLRITVPQAETASAQHRPDRGKIHPLPRKGS